VHFSVENLQKPDLLAPCATLNCPTEETCVPPHPFSSTLTFEGAMIQKSRSPHPPLPLGGLSEYRSLEVGTILSFGTALHLIA